MKITYFRKPYSRAGLKIENKGRKEGAGEFVGNDSDKKKERDERGCVWERTTKVKYIIC